MQIGGARLLATFDPCVLAEGTVAPNIPDEQRIQVVAANLQGNQATQSATIPIQRLAPIAEGQSLLSKLTSSVIKRMLEYTHSMS